MCCYYGAIDLIHFKELAKRYIDYDISRKNLREIIYNGAEYYGEFEFSGFAGKNILVEDAYHIMDEQLSRENIS